MNKADVPVHLGTAASDPDLLIMGLAALLLGSILLIFLRREVGAIALIACVIGAILAV